MRAPLLRRFLVVVAGMLGARSYFFGLLQTLVAQKDFLKAETIFGERSTKAEKLVGEDAKGNFSLFLHKLPPFNFTVSPDGRTISFRAPRAEGVQKEASILIIDANGAVSEQKILRYSDKVLLDLWFDATKVGCLAGCVACCLGCVQCPGANMWGIPQSTTAPCRPCATVRAASPCLALPGWSVLPPLPPSPLL